MAAITILDTATASVVTPSSGHTSLFIDDTSGTSTLKMKDSTGNVIVVGSGGGGGDSFTGNLAGNVLYDGINNRISSNAYPFSALPTSAMGFNLAATNIPVYSGGNLTPQSFQTIASATSGNVVLNSGGGAARRAIFNSTVGFVTASGGMNSNDRVFNSLLGFEVRPEGNNWGSGNNTRNTIAGQATQVVVNNTTGTSSIGHVVGQISYVDIEAQSGATVIGEAVSSMSPQIGIAAGGSTGTKSITTARCVFPYIEAYAGGTITNAIGIHYPSGWTFTSGGGSITNKYAIKIDDTTSPIVTASPITTTNVMTVGSYASTALPAGTVGSLIAISDNEGRMAYWNTTHNAWQYVFNNSNV